MSRQVFLYANGESGYGYPVVVIQKQSTEEFIRLSIRIDYPLMDGPGRVGCRSSLSVASWITKFGLERYSVLRRNDETSRLFVGPYFNQCEIDDWWRFRITMRLFDEADFAEKIRLVPRPRQTPISWKEPDPNEPMRIEGLFLDDPLLFRWSLSAGAIKENGRIGHHTYVLNKHKYFATYEVCFAKHLLFCMVICISVSQCETSVTFLSARNRLIRSAPIDVEGRKWLDP